MITRANGRETRFTLVELLVVIAVLGVLAVVYLMPLYGGRPDYAPSVSRI